MIVQNFIVRHCLPLRIGDYLSHYGKVIVPSSGFGGRISQQSHAEDLSAQMYMQATKLLQEHFQLVCRWFRTISTSLTEPAWTARPLRNMNPPAWIVWHLARTDDAVVHTAIRGTPEIITQARWAACGALATPGNGIGQTMEEAIALAHAITPEDVSAYAEAVHSEMLAWLATLSDDFLDVVPDIEAHFVGHPEYQIPAVMDIVGMPVWSRLLELCLIHSEDHLAELAIIKQQI
jgi:hypothetical protein